MNPNSFVGALLFLLGLPSTSYACSCASPPPLSERLNSSKHVFVAQVRSSTLSADGKWIEATFEVEEPLKGDPRKVPSIKLQFTETNYRLPRGLNVSCPDLQISPGMHFLVFATDDAPALYAHCTNTLVLSKSDDGRVLDIRSIVHQK